jgi:nicotinamide mononucleotide transporter
MEQFLIDHWLDIFTTILGLIYLFLEYKASIALWIVGIIMPALDVYLYYMHGLYGDAGMAVYYTLAAVYGYIVWKFGRKHGQKEKEEMPITHFKKSAIVPAVIFFFVAWGATYWVLKEYTNSTVPVTDAFTNAMSFVALWALSRKYVEQWFLWLIVDVVTCYLYITKGLPFKSGYYGLNVIIAGLGYLKWIKMMKGKEQEEVKR